MQRTWGICAAVVVAVAALATGFVAPAQADVPVLVLDGKGWGHGVGLAQFGGRFLASQGADAGRILSTFYPGTTAATQQGNVRVAVFTSPNRVTTLSFPDGGEVRSAASGPQAPGFPVHDGPGGQVRVSFDGTYHVEPLVTASAVGRVQRYASDPNQLPPLLGGSTTTTTAPGGGGGGGGGGLLPLPTTTTTTPPPTTPAAPTTTTTAPAPTTQPPGTEAPPPGPPSAQGATTNAPVWAVPDRGSVTTVVDRGRTYRGILQATADAGPLRVVNQLDVEAYLKGMGEVPSQWPAAVLQAQAVVARTYALRAMQAGGELCDYALCQVYIGVTREAASQSAAVDATRGVVLTYGGALATTVYSADAGGVTATTMEGFGTPDGTYPYLQSVRYPTDDPLVWHVEVALSDVASRFGYPGGLRSVTVSQAGPSGRAMQVTLDGDAGPKVVDGRQFASRLGLKSTLFTIGLGSSAAAPPPPPTAADSGLQALPDDVAAIKEATLHVTPRTRAHRTHRAAATLHAGTLGTSTDGRFAAGVVAVVLLGLATAAGMGRFGLLPDHTLLLADRIRHPRLPTRTGPPR
jgi:SpoIID/LytB domain protein